MYENGLYTFTDVASMLCVTRHTIRDLVKRIGIVPKPMTNGKAKGLDSADIRALRRVLDESPRTARV